MRKKEIQSVKKKAVTDRERGDAHVIAKTLASHDAE